jgi:MtN3 and saliva related transmembrane protein
MQSVTFMIIVGLAAGILTSFSMLPQLIKTLKEKKVENISPLMIFILITGVALWLLYGILKKDLPIMLTNGFSLVLNLFMLFLRWRYRRN